MPYTDTLDKFVAIFRNQESKNPFASVSTNEREKKKLIWTNNSDINRVMRQGKCWGYTDSIEENSFCELHRLETFAGSYCSKHLHKYKSNLFFVEKGKILVRVWQLGPDKDPDETILETGMTTKVPPGLYHQFEAIDDSIVYELYFPQGISHDIERLNIGAKSTDKGTKIPDEKNLPSDK